MLVGSIDTTFAFFNWVEYEGYVHDDWGTRSGVKVYLKDGSTVLDTDLTDGYGYFYIKEYVESSKHYTLKAKVLGNNNFTMDECTVLGRSTGEPWPHNLTVQFVTTHALIVGIETYENYLPETYADNDADAWYQQFTDESGLDFDNVTLLKNSAATKSTINSSLSAVVSEADGGDIIAFIFSGKGYSNDTNWALAAYDAYGEGEEGYLADTELAAIMEDSLAERVFFFFDCCNASGMRYELADLDNSDTFFIAASTTDNQESEYDNTEDLELRCWTQCFLNYAWNAAAPQGYGGSISEDFFNICGTAIFGYTQYDLGGIDYYDYSTQTPQRYDYYNGDFCLSKSGITRP